MILDGFRPKLVWQYFELMSSVPRGSGNTDQISKLLYEEGKKLGFDTERDLSGNVKIEVPASEGYENVPPVILQAHMDMVCVTDASCAKDMRCEPVSLCSDGKKVWADGTSLGADDGIGIALILAVLADREQKHPAIEAVFTVDEETGMYGARDLDKGSLKAKRMIGIDSGTFGVFTCGCAGGSEINISLPVVRETLNAGDAGFKLVIEGLKGGHSGACIHKGYANANRLMARLLYGLSLKTRVRIASFEGGQAGNAITDRCEAVAVVPKEQAADFERLAVKHEKLFLYEYGKADPGIRIIIEPLKADDCPCDCVIFERSKAASRLLCTIPDGVRSMSKDLDNLVQTSSNLGIVRLERGSFEALSLLRSSDPEEREEVIKLYEQIVQHDKGSLSITGEYPAWVYRKASPLRDLAVEVYREQTGKEAVIEATHAGLEGGIFDEAIEDLDAINIGPDLSGIHSPKETVDIASVEKCYAFLCRMLEKMH